MTTDQLTQLKKDLEKLRNGGFTRINNTGHKIYLEYTIPFKNIESLLCSEPEDNPAINLNGWQTIKHYADSKGIDTHVVTNWIRRTPQEKVQHKKYPELNGLVLVKEKTQN